MKALLLGLLLYVNVSSAATNEMHPYDAQTFILNHLELPAVGTVGNFERSKSFTDVSISIVIDKYGWGFIAFQSSQGNFRIDRAADRGLFEELLDSPQVKSGNANHLWVGCQYTLGQKAQNWFAPFIATCKFSF